MEVQYELDVEKAKTEDEFYYYFAYGSNMNLEQMAFRCPQSIKVGHGVMKDYHVVEALYADIDASEGNIVNGLVWKVNSNDLASLDKYEGFPKRYFRFITPITVSDKEIHCVVYKMTDECRKERSGKEYPEAYRLRCRKGAEDNSIPSAF
ncbi:hypothetical protein TVAG_160120 [Trichomonas vaginalis G3]|uniref:gamma-glutamylcyclotransferase n=1 Tax=Trichomonas vaginalis (strain ATCC PRA-98 / G3) TaxID=412133 RepID=A2DUV4_TRIV3|nr:AIG2-like family [Trichomonas vaginalis G3]EAY15839.1 hypothetical protein TVAG_160120 [Trichomonas vaginalis G3]KAI5524992.1 AIG2-like family [Trichomonas vaginalis G3]|eukprot:XP_001328062.1 hypothetical protein [Trichomonas vaginalis G3]